jgi:hypothetical protein
MASGRKKIAEKEKRMVMRTGQGRKMAVAAAMLLVAGFAQAQTHSGNSQYSQYGGDRR